MVKKEEKKTLADYSPSEKDKKVIARWQKRFEVAKRYRKPYEAKVVRMHKLKRAYRDPLKYNYMTRLMPPIGFRVIQTISTRLEAAKMTVSIRPNDKEYAEDQEAIEDWEKLIAFNLQENNWDDIKNDYIDNQQTEGNAYAQVVWDHSANGPKIVLRDWFLTLFDPNAGPRLEGSEWEILQSYKTKARILKDEKKRGKKIYNSLEYIENRTIEDDPRREREAIETLKMGQVRTARNIDNDKDDLRDRETEVVDDDIKQVEIRECYDHITDEILVFMNDGEVLVRREKNPYADIDDGQMIVDLPCIRIPHRAYSMAQLEPVETLIIEIADSRNQVSDDIIFNLDPIRKVKKGSGVEKQDLTVGPGEKWVLKDVDDVVLERGVGLDRSWIDKDNMLNDEVDKTLALPEYTSGVPNSSQEPSSKVEALLGQTQIRLGKFLRHYEIAISDIVNKMIQLNQKMLQEVEGEEGEEETRRGRSYRLIKDGKVTFEEFKSVDIGVDAKVRFDLKEEKTPDKRKEEAWAIYDKFILEDRPSPEDTEAMNIWLQERAVVRKIVLKEYDKEQYTKLLTKMQQKEEEAQQPPAVGPAEGPAEPPAEAPQLPTPPPEPIPLIPQEPQAESPGFLQKLLGRVRG